MGLLGQSGRMAQAISKELDNRSIHYMSYSRNDSSQCLESLFELCDVVIDFTKPQGLFKHITLAKAYKTPLVIGTTGFSKKDFDIIEEASKHLPIMYAANTSLGITLINDVLAQWAKALGDDFDIEISECHHRHKVDAPSGTSLMFGKTLAKGMEKSFEDVAVLNRNDHHAPREKGSIGFSSLRGGAYVCGHDIHFISDDEMVTLSHKSFSRAVYAKGTIRAAQWLVGKNSGLYTMKDVLGL
jgi:4-hydroxy-tetrahydrodipicolinate reductase